MFCRQICCIFIGKKECKHIILRVKNNKYFKPTEKRFPRHKNNKCKNSKSYTQILVNISQNVILYTDVQNIKKQVFQ
jgi:hypothetical protein